MSYYITLFFIYIYVCLSQDLNNNRVLPLIEASIATESVRTDPDDPAIWIHPNQPELSLIIGTDKKAGIGGLYVFNLDGKIIQHIDNIDRPNNVDVEYGFKINETYFIDLVVFTERLQSRLRIFSININTGQLYEITGRNTNVFIDSIGMAAAPMGLALYKRPSDKKIYAIVSRKSGPNYNYLGQYELIWNQGLVDLKFIRYFGDYHGTEIESIVVDDQLGHVYYCDESYGIRKYNVDPNTNQTEQIGFINTTNLWQGDSEGLAIYTTSDRNGYLITTDQISHGAIFHIFERQGTNSYIKSIKTRADRTDGIEATKIFFFMIGVL
ncbi:unnamed protein product [Rotaria magnacalcarata]|uniref:BPP domain-containing protein n=1 Tax=Rotaria magnacalcarata TaxID=392030 RepID=A0A816U8E9_9BILA|nr:unnamed protein product [Rotaria magnacalcarata]CAF1587933.1 unnamed protein product [Rotaria magnacalcarata]CAF2110786.1 unnamed protein product [Rotaria magnacalcarata]CAF4257029.1 unnamed protein product [Rotaria magnacalcarata]CAF4463557.1 unnamed protein product [Rotaria magnacalcarata]